MPEKSKEKYKEIVNGILVWFTLERLNIFNKETMLYDEGDYVCYFSFSSPEGCCAGELIKDKDCKPVSWKTVKDALKDAKLFVRDIKIRGNNIESDTNQT